jgi:integrase
MKHSIYKRKDGRWEGYVIYNDPDTGEECKKSFYEKGRYGQNVKLQVSEFMGKIENGDYSDIKKVTVEGCLKKFLEVYCKKLEQTTKEGYKRYIEKHINPRIGKLLVKDIKPVDIERFYNSERDKEFSEKTILQEHRILHRAFKKAMSDGLMSKNPCDGVDAPSPEDYEPTVYNEEQFIELLNKLHGHRMESIILIAGMCGLRRGELLGLTWEDIDFESNLINVHKNRVPTHENGVIEKGTKTKKSTRIFTIPSVIMPELKRIRGIGKLYTCINGSEYHPGSVSKAFSEFLRSNGLPHIRLHDLRHFNCTMMLKHGISEREAMERSGHSTSTQIKKYQHIIEDMDKKSADKLNKVLSKKSKNKTVKHTVKF